MEHTNRDQVIVDVTSTVAGIHVNGVKDSDEVLLAQSVDIIANDELETSETTCHNLVTLVFKRFTNCHDNDSPSFVLDLLSTGLNNLLEALDHS